MTPGPLAVNTSTFVGMRLAGMAGAVAATGGCVLCGIVISLASLAGFSAATAIRKPSAAVGNAEISLRRPDRRLRRNDRIDRLVRSFLLEATAALQQFCLDHLCARVVLRRQGQAESDSDLNSQRLAGCFFIYNFPIFRNSLVSKLN